MPISNRLSGSLSLSEIGANAGISPGLTASLASSNIRSLAGRPSGAISVANNFTNYKHTYAEYSDWDAPSGEKFSFNEAYSSNSKSWICLARPVTIPSSNSSGFNVTSYRWNSATNSQEVVTYYVDTAGSSMYIFDYDIYDNNFIFQRTIKYPRYLYESYIESFYPDFRAASVIAGNTLVLHRSGSWYNYSSSSDRNVLFMDITTGSVITNITIPDSVAVTYVQTDGEFIYIIHGSLAYGDTLVTIKKYGQSGSLIEQRDFTSATASMAYSDSGTKDGWLWFLSTAQNGGRFFERINVSGIRQVSNTLFSNTTDLSRFRYDNSFNMYEQVTTSVPSSNDKYLVKLENPQSYGYTGSFYTYTGSDYFRLNISTQDNAVGPSQFIKYLYASEVGYPNQIGNQGRESDYANYGLRPRSVYITDNNLAIIQLNKQVTTPLSSLTLLAVNLDKFCS